MSDEIKSEIPSFEEARIAKAMSEKPPSREPLLQLAEQAKKVVPCYPIKVHWMVTGYLSKEEGYGKKFWCQNAAPEHLRKNLQVVSCEKYCPMFDLGKDVSGYEPSLFYERRAWVKMIADELHRMGEPSEAEKGNRLLDVIAGKDRMYPSQLAEKRLLGEISRDEPFRWYFFGGGFVLDGDDIMHSD
ncbi:MAG: hypothetical protein WA093_00300 [Minisyncoccales bacterium]